MENTVTISISGVLFHLNQESYELLKSYLDEMREYFNHYSDKDEIIADIENRIAEHLLLKTGQGKKAVSYEMVNELIATIGKPEDLAAEENYFSQESSFHFKENKHKKREKLYRITENKVIAGVAAGLADYFKINVRLIRVLMVLAMFDFFLSFSISSIVLLGYILCWIFVPATDKSIDHVFLGKKLFRDPDHKMIAGVATGLSYYLNLDVVLVRILFILSVLIGGGGILIYLVLWIVTPKAITLNEKAQMKGTSEPFNTSHSEFHKTNL